MKILSIPFLLLFLAQSAGFSQWAAESSGTNLDLLGVAALDRNTAIVVGDSGIILKTTDQGKHWSQKSSGTNLLLRRIHFTDDSTGIIWGRQLENGETFHLNDSSFFLRTNDRGETWTVMQSPVEPVISFYALTALTYFVGDATGNILRTINGGGSWLGVKVSNGPIGPMCFRDSSLGYVLPLVSKTSTNGVSWEPANETLFVAHEMMAKFGLAGEACAYTQWSSDAQGPVFARKRPEDSSWRTYLPSLRRAESYCLDVSYSASDTAYVSGNMEFLGGVHPFCGIIKIGPHGTDIVPDYLLSSDLSYLYGIDINPIAGIGYAVGTGGTILIKGFPVLKKFDEGWNLVSLWNSVDAVRKDSVFPNTLSGAFKYVAGKGYVRTDSLEQGRGYWVKFGQSPGFSINADSILADTVDVVKGWNIIGGLSAPVAVSTITHDPPDMSLSQFYGYDKGYSAADPLMPARGYWVKANKVGRLFLSASPITR